MFKVITGGFLANSPNKTVKQQYYLITNLCASKSNTHLPWIIVLQ